MARAHLYRPITDNEGNVVPNTTVTLFEPGTTQVLGQTLWTDPNSLLTPQVNPWTTSDGYIDVYLDTPQTVRIGLQAQGAEQTFIDNVSVGPAPENQVYALTGFKITNSPNSGQYLQSGQPGQAAWVDAGDIVNGKPTPLQQLKDYDWSSGTLDDAVALDGAGASVLPGFLEVGGEDKPTGWTFSRALQLPGSAALHLPSQTWPEAGQVIYLYKVVSGNAGIGAAQLTVSVDDAAIATATPLAADLMNTWQVGYLDKIPSGTHRVLLSHAAGSDVTSYVALGPVWLQYGFNIPAHDHHGAGENSTALGPSAAAGFLGATSVGAQATALGASATQFGFRATASAGGTALGAGAAAGTNAVAVGANAGNSSAWSSWVAVGDAAVVGADSATAVGARAKALGTSSLALGAGAGTGAVAKAVAVGSGAQALALGAVAFGADALVPAGHDYSLAIGPGVVTTAAHQARIGDDETTVVIPGSLRQVGGDAVIGSTSGHLGFFGSEGVTQPVVVGSRGGNAVLGQLLTLLDGMGLIKNQSTA
jgi:hypothetical protein